MNNFLGFLIYELCHSRRTCLYQAPFALVSSPLIFFFDPSDSFANIKLGGIRTLNNVDG